MDQAADSKNAPTFEDALKQYDDKRQYYEKITKYASDALDKALQDFNEKHSEKDGELLARVLSRTKTAKSLADNVRLSPERDALTTWEKIRDAYHDLSGVRLILYNPGKKSRDRAEKLVKGVWPEAKLMREYLQKQPEEDKSQGYTGIHRGYQAMHFSVNLEKVNGFNPADRLDIQIVSALMHGLAETQHDITYKRYKYGQPSEEEERILDAVNGLVLSGDLLLEQFYKTFFNRVYKPIQHVDELSHVLQEISIRDMQMCEKYPLACRGYLVEVLLAYASGFPKATREILEEVERSKMDNNPTTRFNLNISLGFTKKKQVSFNDSLRGFLQLVLWLKGNPKFRTAAAPTFNNDDQKKNAMITTMILLDDFLDSAAGYIYCAIQEHKMLIALAHVVSMPSRVIAPGLDEVVTPNLPRLWQWFEERKGVEDSFAGFAFHLVTSGIIHDRANVEHVKQTRHLSEQIMRIYSHDNEEWYS
jgi:ppGpp synthetase/RelA/SpoT-type nucleotidyltranferase